MDKKRYGVIGLGSWGKLHIQVYQQHPFAEVVSVCDRDADKARETAKKYDIGHHTTDAAELLARDDIDAVSVATPDFAHTELVLSAIDAGKAVIVEKPLATSLEDCEKIASAAEKAGATVMVDFHNRWNPAFVQAKNAVDNGEIGSIRLIYYRMSDTIFVPTELLPWADKTTVSWFIGSHSVDTIMWLLGEMPEYVYSVSRSVVLKERGIDTPDFFESVLEFPSGAVAVLDNSWIVPNTSPIIIDFNAQILGSDGALYVDISHNRTVQKYTKEKASYLDVLVRPEIHGKVVGLGAESISHFATAMANGEKPLVGVREGLAATRVLAAIEESCRRKERIKIEGET